MPLQILETPIPMDRGAPSPDRVCGECGRPLYFFSDRLYGRSMQECGCGIQPVQPVRVRPVYIPASLIADESTMPFGRTRTTCPVCAKSYLARTVDGAPACSAKCRRRLEKAK